jgi:sugar-specific transcriptional regulator TrmB
VENIEQKNQIIEAAEMLGFSDKMSAVYLASLELGGGSVAEIAKLSGVERVNTYYVLEQLQKDGFVYSGLLKKKIAYFAESPKKLLEAMEAKTRKFSEIIPQLLAMENSHATKPVIRFYEGIEGIKKVFEETLLLPKGSETLAFVSYSTVRSHLKEWTVDFIKRRAAKGIAQRCIAENTQQVQENLVANDVRDLRETRVVDKERYPFELDQLNIFGNKIFIASYTDMLALVIEGPAIAKTMRSIFELAWCSAQKIEA